MRSVLTCKGLHCTLCSHTQSIPFGTIVLFVFFFISSLRETMSDPALRTSATPPANSDEPKKLVLIEETPFERAPPWSRAPACLPTERPFFGVPQKNVLGTGFDIALRLLRAPGLAAPPVESAPTNGLETVTAARISGQVETHLAAPQPTHAHLGHLGARREWLASCSAT